MKVKLFGQISGSRNGQEWPKPGTIVDLPDDEAQALVRQCMAVELDDEDAKAPVSDFGKVETAAADAPVETAAAGRSAKG